MNETSMSDKHPSVVVFKLWKSLSYQKRIVVSFSLILCGLILQYFTLTLLPGIPLVVIGTFLILPKGYDNRLDLGKFHPGAEWEKVNQKKVVDFIIIERKMKRWDRSLIDISNPLGIFAFLAVLLGLGILGFQLLDRVDVSIKLIFWNAIILILPLWFTGLRRISLIPNMTRKIKLILGIIVDMEPQLKEHNVDYFFQLQGEANQAPKDVKFRINIKDHHCDFLGLYGQIVMNQVQNQPYPYFYVVLVSKKNFGLEQTFQNHTIGHPFKVEFKKQGDVDVLVIRQNTKTVKKGYYTKPKQALEIFKQGLNLAEQVAIK